MQTNINAPFVIPPIRRIRPNCLVNTFILPLWVCFNCTTLFVKYRMFFERSGHNILLVWWYLNKQQSLIHANTHIHNHCTYCKNTNTYIYNHSLTITLTTSQCITQIYNQKHIFSMFLLVTHVENTRQKTLKAHNHLFTYSETKAIIVWQTHRH